jgi:hypothetical protein
MLMLRMMLSSKVHIVGLGTSAVLVPWCLGLTNQEFALQEVLIDIDELLES